MQKLYEYTDFERTCRHCKMNFDDYGVLTRHEWDCSVKLSKYPKLRPQVFENVSVPMFFEPFLRGLTMEMSTYLAAYAQNTMTLVQFLINEQAVGYRYVTRMVSWENDYFRTLHKREIPFGLLRGDSIHLTGEVA